MIRLESEHRIDGNKVKYKFSSSGITVYAFQKGQNEEYHYYVRGDRVIFAEYILSGEDDGRPWVKSDFIEIN